MAKVSNREDALLNAYMTRYKNAQASTVSEGQNKTSTARARGAAILNATDKTLPALKDTYSDTLSGIVQGASLENSLTNDILDRNLKLAKARFDQANDLNEQLQKAQQYAEKQAAKAAKAAAKRSGKSTSGSGSTGSGSTGGTGDADTATTLDALFGSGTAGTGSTAGSAAGSTNKKDDEKTDKNAERKEKREAWQKSQREHRDEVLKAQEQQREKTVETVKNAGKSVVKAVVGGLSAPARGGNQADKESQYQKRQLMESGRVFTKDGQINQRYKEIEQQDKERKEQEKSNQRSVGSRAADLVKGVGKQAAGAILSFLEAPAGGGSAENRQAQHDMRMLMENGLAMNADGSVSDAYQKALDRFENTKNDQDVLSEQFVPALGLVKEGSEQVQRGGEGLSGIGKGAYNIAAMGANMAPGMALGLINPAFGTGYMGLTAAGNKLAEESEKGMGSRDALLRGTASGLISTGTNAVPIGEFANITKNGSPILQAALKEGVENAGQEAADYLLNTAADYALKDPDASFSLQDMAGQVGMGAATGAAFGALGGVLNRGGTQIANAETAAEQANQNVLLKDDNRITADQNDLYSALDNAQENYIPGLETDYATLAEQSRNAAQQARNEALRADPRNASDIMDAYDAALEALPTLQKDIGTDNTSAWNSRLGDTFGGNVAGRQYSNVEGSRITAPVTIDTTNRAGYNVDNMGGVQNGTEIDAGRSLEGAESGRTGTGYPDVQGTGRNADGNQRVFRQPVMDDSQRQAVESTGATWGNIQDTTADPQRFSKALDESIAANKHGLMVSPKSVEELQRPGTITFMGEDGLSGALVTADGDIEAVFKNPASKTKRASTQLLITAVENGGTKLDCYGADLVNTYNRFGFEPVAKVEWNPDYAPDGWTYGPKDVYVMKLQDGMDADSILQRLGKSEADGGFHTYTTAELDALPTMEYDEALAYRDSLINAPPADAGGAAVSAPLNGSERVPENAVGATNARYSTDKIVENKDYANQAATRAVLDDAHREGLTYSKHQVWTDTEAQHQALDDINTYIQEAGGDVDKGLENAMNTLRKDTQWDKGESVTANNIRDRLRTEYMNTQPGTPEFYRQKARYDDWQSEISKQRSKVAQTMQSFTGDATARMHEVSNPIREKWETQHSVEAARIKQLSDELDKLKAEVAQRNLDDMNSQDFTKGVVSGADRFPVQDNVKFPQSIREGAQKAGDMDAEFGQMLKDNGIPSEAERVASFSDADKEKYKTATEEAYNSIVARVKKLCEKNKVNIDDDGVKTIAGKIMNGDNAESYYNSLIMQAAGISDLSIDEMEMVDDLYSQAAKLPDSKERYDLEQQAIGIMAKHLPAADAFEKWDNCRFLAMLGNTTTHARNILGNIGNMATTTAENEISALMQRALPKEARTKALYTPKSMKNAAEDYIMNQRYSELVGKTGTSDLTSSLQAGRKIYGDSFGGKMLQKLTDINSGLLAKEDDIFVKRGMVNSLASNLTAKGLDESIFTATDAHSKQILDEAVTQAVRDAAEMTYHIDNAATEMLSKFSHMGDKRGGIGQKIGYCITNGLLPFAKTTANIAKTSLTLNPVGAAVEGVYRAGTHKGAAAVMDSVAKGAVGTGLIAFGKWAAEQGYLTGSLDADTKDYDEMTGKQEYSLNIPGVGSYTLDWLAPMAVPVMIGANLKDMSADDVVNTLLADPAKFAGQIGDILLKSIDPIANMSVVQSANKALNNLKYAGDNGMGAAGTLLSNALTSYAQQYVPTMLGKAARTVDDTRRSSYGGGDSYTERNRNYLARSTINKIPGLSMNNEPYIDQWGREEASLDGTDDTAGGMFLRGVYNFGSPGYLSAENITPVDEYLQGLYGSTNDSHVYPEKASSKITVDSDDYYMTPEEKTEYAKTSGQTAYDLIDELRQNDMFLRLPEDQQSALVQDAYSVAKTVGGVAAVGDGVSGVGAKEYEAYRDGGAEGFSQYVLMKNATDLVRDEKRETSGNDSAKLNDVETWNTLYSQFGEDAVGNFVNSTKDDSTVRNISDLAGDKAVTAYMQSYSAVAKTLDDDQTPDKFTVGYGMQKYGLSGDDFARAYLAAYYKKDKNGKYPEKGGSYADKAGAEIYQRYGADALRDWVNYRATIPDTNGNGKVDKDEAMARLNEMDLTNEMRRAYLTKTNKQWKNPY